MTTTTTTTTTTTSTTGSPVTAAMNELTVLDLNTFHKLEFVVAEAFDNHHWDSIRSLLAPTLTMDLSEVHLPSKEMSAEEYIGIVENEWKNGKHIRHHSFMGGGYYEKISDDYAIGRRQLMTVFLLHNADDHGETDGSTTGSGMREVYFKKVNGEWKWGGNKVKMQLYGEGYEKLPHSKNLPQERKLWHQ